MLTFDEKKVITNETKVAVEKILFETKRCFLERPTGFGKTWLMSELMANKKFDKIVYLYPRDIIKLMVQEDYKDKLADINVEYYTYSRLVSLNKQKHLQSHFAHLYQYKNVLFVVDEAHMAGATKTNRAIRILQEMFPQAYWFGGSATPFRADGFNVVHEFFADNKPFDFGFKEAIEKGLYPKPTYIFANFESEKTCDILEENIKNSQLSKGKKDEILSVLGRTKLQHSKLNKMDTILSKYIPDKKYQKWFVFFPTQDILLNKIDDVQKWYQEAFPNFTVVTHIVMSSPQYRRNIMKVQQLQYQENVIDLICCIDMLNMGYHVKDVDGIMMLRMTASDIIYKQQIGRTLSVTSESPAIIFDVVGNFSKCQYVGASKVAEQKFADVNDDYTIDDVLNVFDETLGVDQVYRLWKQMLLQESEELVTTAYAYKSATAKWAIKHLGLKSNKDLGAVLEKYGLHLRTEDAC